MDLKQIKQVIDLMKRSDLTEFEFEEEGFKIKIKRGVGGQPIVTSSPVPTSNFIHDTSQGAYPPPSPENPPVTAGGDEVGFAFVKSPMVGTFYRSPSPENPSFVEVGAKVEDKSVVCIIEAMKIMNEIQAEVKGSITEILVENGQPVEYGQRLFKIKLSS
ncbi:MAG TPA: acetyl-CoA carboxylase biotin carboxyl carrier protein [Lacunisphaera sp.]